MKLLEKGYTRRTYDIRGINTIIEHGGRRLLLVDGLGGIDSPAGGRVGWEHGSVFQLRPTDTLQTLHSEMWDDTTTLWSAVVNDFDPSRPRLMWTGSAIEAIAEKLNL